MARYIHCEHCNKKMAKSSEEFGELYESIEGVAKRDMFCDGACGGERATEIKKGDKCFASVLLTNRKHPAYPFQKPSEWAHEFITPIK